MYITDWWDRGFVVRGDGELRLRVAHRPHFLTRYTGGRSKPAPLRREKQKQKQRRLRRLRKLKILDLIFEIGETATAEANSRTPRATTAHGTPEKRKQRQLRSLLSPGVIVALIEVCSRKMPAGTPVLLFRAYGGSAGL
jgi:hypothetical protein